MFGKVQKEDMVYFLWYSGKLRAGDTPTPEETARMLEGSKRTESIAKLVFQLRENEYEYTGQPFR